MTPQSSRQFSRIADLLTDRPLVLPDRIGFGDSDELTGPISIEQAAAATLEALGGLGINRFDVVGIHTGSNEAIELATAQPDRVRRIGVVGIPAFNDEERAAFSSEGPPPLKPDGSHLLDTWSLVQRPDLQPPVDGVRWTVEDVNRQAVLSLRAGPAKWWMHNAVRQHRTVERMREVRQPFLVLAPHDDVWAETQRALPELPRHAQVVELPHMAYEAFTLHAEVLADEIRSFLDAPTPARA